MVGTSTSSKRGFAAEIVCLVLLLTVGLCISLPRFRSGIEFEDEGNLAYGAQRVLEGQIPNRDFVSLQPPLYYYTAAAAFKVLGPSLLSLRILGVGIYLALPLLLYGISRQFSGRLLSVAAALPATILGLPYINFVPFAPWQGNVVALMAVLAYLLALRPGARAAWAGVAGGLTATTMLLRQDQGFYLMAALGALNLMLRFARSRVAAGAPADDELDATRLNRLFLCWLGGMGLILVPFSIYWLIEGVWPDILRQLVLFPTTTYRKTSWLPFPSLHTALVWGPDIINLLFFVPPVLYLLVALWLACRVGRRYFGRQEARVAFLLLWSGLFYCQVLVRSDVQHMLITLPPFFILAGWAFRWGLTALLSSTTVQAVEKGSPRATGSLKRGVQETRSPARPRQAREVGAKGPAAQPAAGAGLLQQFFRGRNLAGVGICCLAAGLMAVFLWLAAQDCLPPRLGPEDALTLKHGGLRIQRPGNLDAFIQTLQSLAPADRSMLCLPYQAMLYFLCERRNPTRWNYLWPGDQTPDELQALVEQAQRDPPSLVVLSNEENLRSYAPPVVAYVHRNYRLVAEMKGRRIYQPK